VALLVIPACAGLRRTGEPQWSGLYAWTADAGSWHGEGHLELECAGSCSGTLISPFGSNPISRSQITDGTLHVVVDTPTGSWDLWLHPAGTDLRGTFSYNRAEGSFDAKRILR
jgi:hypothetical protein